MFDIRVDSREAVSAKKILDGLNNYSDIETKVEHLGESIDYAIPRLAGGWCLIQRKKATEMMNRKGVFDDLIGMKAVENARPYLLIEGTLSIIQKFTRWKPEPIIGIVESVIEDYHVPIIPSPSQYWTTKWLVAKARKVGSEKQHKMLDLRASAPKDLTLPEKARYLMEGFPNISSVLADRILSHYGTLKNALDKFDDWKYRIYNFGEKKSKAVKDILYAEYTKPNTKA